MSIATKNTMTIFFGFLLNMILTCTTTFTAGSDAIEKAKVRITRTVLVGNETFTVGLTVVPAKVGNNGNEYDYFLAEQKVVEGSDPLNTPEDRFGNYLSLNDDNIPNLLNAKFNAISDKVSSKDDISKNIKKQFPNEIPRNSSWEIKHKGEQLYAKRPTVNEDDKRDVFVFDSFHQFVELTSPYVKLNWVDDDPTPTNGETYILPRESNALKTKLLNSAKNRLVATKGRDNECLLITEEEVFWLPLNENKAGKETDLSIRNLVDAILENPGNDRMKLIGKQEFLVLYSKAFFPAKPSVVDFSNDQIECELSEELRTLKDNGMAQAEEQEASIIPFRIYVSWLKEKTLMAESCMRVQNQYQKKLLNPGKTSQLKITDNIKVVTVGCPQFLFTECTIDIIDRVSSKQIGRAVFSVNKNLATNRKKFANEYWHFPLGIDVDIQKKHEGDRFVSSAETLHFKLSVNETTPAYIQHGEFTYANLKSMLAPYIGNGTDKERDWWKNERFFTPSSPKSKPDEHESKSNQLQNANDSLVSIKQQNWSQLDLLDPNKKQVSNTERWMIAWFAHQYAHNAPNPKAGKLSEFVFETSFPLNNLRTWIIERRIQAAESSLPVEKGQNVTETKFKNTLQKTWGIDLNQATTHIARYWKFRQIEKQIEFPNKFIHPDYQPVANISPKMIKELLSLCSNDQITIFALPQTQKLKNALGLSKPIWVDGKRRAIPSKLIGSNAERQNAAYHNVADNVSEISIFGEEYKVVGWNYRTGKEEPLIDASGDFPISLHGYSRAIGFRLALPKSTVCLLAGKELGTKLENESALPNRENGGRESATHGQKLATESQKKKEAERRIKIDLAYQKMYGTTEIDTTPIWKKQQSNTIKYYGDHEFWQVEHLRRVLYGARGHDEFHEELPHAEMIEKIHRLLKGSGKKGDREKE